MLVEAAARWMDFGEEAGNAGRLGGGYPTGRGLGWGPKCGCRRKGCRLSLRSGASAGFQPTGAARAEASSGLELALACVETVLD